MSTWFKPLSCVIYSKLKQANKGEDVCISAFLEAAVDMGGFLNPHPGN